jgi:hypothetical protein
MCTNMKHLSKVWYFFLGVVMNIFASGCVIAQTVAIVNDTTSKISLNATIDTYFHKSFNCKETAPRTSFSNLPGFSLGMINVIGEYSGVKTGFVADLVFGPRGSDAIFNAPLYKNTGGGGSSQLINQMYVYYNLSRRIRVSAGQFNTFLGYESISPAKNSNYSTSYLFSFGPFNHTGIWTDVKIGKQWSAKFAVMNPADYTEYNPFDSYTLGVQISKKYENGLANLNVTYGDPDGSLNMLDSIGTLSAGKACQLDFTATIGVSDKYLVGVSASSKSIAPAHIKISDTEQGALQRSGYYGAAIYQTLAISEIASVSLRTEFFSEFNGGIGAINVYNSSGGASVFASTLSGNFKAHNLALIPEIRIDKTSTGSFTYAGSATPSHQMVSLNFAVIYTLPTLAHQLP